MVHLSKVVTFGVLETAALAQAGILWWHFRRDDRRRKLVRNVQSLLDHAGPSREEETTLKRAA